MPDLIANPCRVPGCSLPQEIGKPYCKKHNPLYSQPLPPTGLTYGKDSFYTHRRWRKARRAYLTAYPLCVWCEERGDIVVATVVDHIIPRRAGGEDYNWNNLQGLCESCHNKKTRNDEKNYPYFRRVGGGGGSKS